MKFTIKKGFINVLLALAIGALAVIAGAGIDRAMQHTVKSPVHKAIKPAPKIVSVPKVTKTIKAPKTQSAKVGAVNYVTGGGTYRLASSVSSSQSTIRLSSFKEPVSGNPYTMSYLNSSLEYGTLDPQTSNSEFISFTGITQNSDGTATLTGVSRGLSRSYPYTASSTFQLTHSGQSIFILSNSPQVYNDIYTYINNLSIAGSVDASASVKGIVQVATGAQAGSTTPIGGGSTSAPLALTTGIATSTCQTAGYYAVITDSNGKINTGCIPTLGTVTMSGTTTFSNTSTSSVVMTATSSLKLGASSAYDIGKHMQIITASSTFTPLQGITKYKVEVVGGGGNGGVGANTSTGGGGGGGGGYCLAYADLSATTSVQVVIGGAGYTSSFGTYCSATTGSNGATTGMPGSYGVGTGPAGTLNLYGQGGGPGINISNVGSGGNGGDSFFGGGGRGNIVGQQNPDSGQNGGGGGGANSGGTAGTGGLGIVIVTW